MPAPSSDSPEGTSTSPLGGVAVGLALVLLAVLVGVIGQRAAAPDPEVVPAAATEVAPTGNTTTVEVGRGRDAVPARPHRGTRR